MSLSWIVGPPGAGKSFFAISLAEKSGVSVVHLDDLFWEPGWNKRSAVDVISRLDRLFLEKPADWLVEGEYPELFEYLFTKADQIIWVDAPLPLLIFRTLRRSLARIIRRTTVCNGNRESLERLFSIDSMPLYTLRVTRLRRAKLQELLSQRSSRGDTSQVFKLTSKREVNKFLNQWRPSERFTR